MAIQTQMTEPLTPAPEEKVGTSPWTVVWRRLRRHKLGMAGAAVLAVLYVLVAFAPFFAVHDFQEQHPDFPYAPPTKIRFVDEDGFHLRPFVYGLKSSRDPVTFARITVEDRSVQHPLRFFVEGDPYKLWGLIPTNIHFIGLGTDSEGVFFPFGTDRFGRDLYSRVLAGGQVTLTVGIFGIALSLLIGVVVGGISGYYGGRLDNIVQRVIELLRSFPTIPLWLALSMALPPSWSSVKVYFGVITVLSLIGWTGLARVVRGQFLAARESEFVEAARALGAKDGRVIFRHILPNTMSYVIVSATLAFPGMIIGESSISFLGLGIREPMTSWGLLLKDAQTLAALSSHPWLLIPGIFIVVSVLAFNFVGDAVRDAFDPHANV